MINPERIQMIVAQVLQSENLLKQNIPVDLDIGALVQSADVALGRYQNCPLKEQLQLVSSIRTLWQSKIDEMVGSAHAHENGNQADKKALFTHLLEHTLDARAIESKSLTGDNGLTLIDYSAYGLFLVVLPERHVLETFISHTISLLSAGNAVVFLVPEASLDYLNHSLALIEPLLKERQLLHLISTVPLKTHYWASLSQHSSIKAIVTGESSLLLNSPAVLNKKTFISEPKPVAVIVDESADLKNAAHKIMQGATFDGNLLLCAEKFVILTEEAFDYFNHCLEIEGGVWLDALKAQLLNEASALDACYGLPLQALLDALNCHTSINSHQRMALIHLNEEDLNTHHFAPLRGLPVLFVLKAKDVSHAISLAQSIDCSAHFMTIMHSKNIDHLSRCAREMQTSVFIKNAPSYAALGMEGEGFPSLFFANITGEGPLHPKDYARKRRCVLAEGFLIR